MHINESLQLRTKVRLFFCTLGTGPHKAVILNAAFNLRAFKCLADNGDPTLIFYDLQKGGQSQHVTDRAKLEPGVEYDIEDLDAVRAHFGIDRVAVMKKLRNLRRRRRRHSNPVMFSDYTADLRHLGD